MEEQVKLFHAFGLGPLAIIQPGRIDYLLVAANIERWRFETNTFHFNIHIGEMTPTLFDVYEILGAVMDGDPVTCRPIKDLRKFTKDNLGIVPDGNLVSLSVTIFADASISTVPTRYLQFFEAIEGANTYAWGAAALALLYRSLEKTCIFKRRHFSGSATLIQCWSYEHIMHMRPILHSIPPNMLKAKRWEPLKKYHGNPHNLMPPIRQEIDSLQPNEVNIIWNPYFNPDEVISNDRQQTEYASNLEQNMTFLRIPCLLVRGQTDKLDSEISENVNADKITNWLSRHDRIMLDIQQYTDNGLPLEEYKA
ncbi:protein MAIN-LIKE 2-like [Amborella trichopoda]|uniref:protein MAIN-LIKE 2-like n=1 Tax=Amborella trichopoda TaxID=13333 RepID=UPI0005D2F7E9|nr:protein MAIN-LIKE 2-like [Amborella trichopoda]|eukprot:XP_011625877.1 protein MAIN-LIKE 2-like [Amborella trichopoda]